MAQVARLNIDLVARTAKFTSGLKTAQSSLRTFQSQIGSMMLAGKAFLGAYIGMRTVVAIKNFVKTQLEAGDALDTVSDRLGIAANDLIVLRQAAKEYANVEAETLDTLLGKFESVISEAARAKKTLVGLNAKSLKTMGLAKAFETVATAISKIPNAMDQVNEARKLFGRGGAEIVTLLNKGAEAIAVMREEIRAAGLTLSDLDIKALSGAADKMDRLGFVLEIVRLKLVAGIAPALIVIANNFMSMGKAGADSVSGIQKAVDALNISFAATSQFLATIQTYWLGWKILLKKDDLLTAKLFGASQETQKKMRRELNIMIRDLNELKGTNWAEKFFIDMEKVRDKLNLGGKGREDAMGIGGLVEKLKPAAIQRGDPGVQKYIKATSGANKMAELVKLEKDAAKDIKLSQEHLKRVREYAQKWADVGIMAF